MKKNDIINDAYKKLEEDKTVIKNKNEKIEKLINSLDNVKEKMDKKCNSLEKERNKIIKIRDIIKDKNETSLSFLYFIY